MPYSISKPINILIVVTSMGPGGLESYIVNVLSAIDRTKFKVIIVSTGKNNKWYDNELSQLGVSNIYCPNAYTQLGYIYNLQKIIKNQGVDVVCDFRNDFAAPTLWAAKCAGVKSRVAMYRSTKRAFKPTLSRRLYAGLLHRCTRCWATKILGNSKKVLDSFYPNWHENSRFAVVYNGVNIDKFLPNESGQSVRNEFGIDCGKIVIGHVGRFHNAKNHENIIKVFARLKAENDDVHLMLVGEGDLRWKVDRMIQEYGLEGDVSIVGLRKDVHRMLNAMDIFFFPSLYEGFPNALLEAMACELPVIASNISEIVEIMPEEFYRYLFNPYDVEGFVDALKPLLLNKHTRKKIGSQARIWVEQRFSIKASAHTLVRELTEGLSCCR
jgi:glycosyltransferase involved in cell wall biosynthesis